MATPPPFSCDARKKYFFLIDVFPRTTLYITLQISLVKTTDAVTSNLKISAASLHIRTQFVHLVQSARSGKDKDTEKAFSHQFVSLKRSNCRTI